MAFNGLQTSDTTFCTTDDDCPFQSLCGSEGWCAHKGLLPLSLADTLLWVLIFAISGLANAAGLAGGSVMIPAIILLGGFSTFLTLPMVQIVACGGVSVALLYRVNLRHPTQNKPRIDFNIAMQLNLPLLLGTGYGVMANKLMPEWVVLLGLVLLMGFSAIKMLQKYGICRAIDVDKQGKTMDKLRKPLIDLHDHVLGSIQYPTKSIMMLVVIFAYVLLALFLRGGRGVDSLIGITDCTPGYWLFTLFYSLISLFMISLTSLVLVTQTQHKVSMDYKDEDIHWTYDTCIKLTGIGILAGFVTGLLGLTGGVFIAPLLLTLGVRPEVSASTCTLLVFFTSSIASVQFSVSGMVLYDYALFYCSAAVAGSLLGVTIIERLMERRKSVGIFALAIVMGLSTVLVSVRGGISTIENLKTEAAVWGFRPYCQ